MADPEPTGFYALIGKEVDYYGVVKPCTFGLSHRAFTAVEDESDGYRSYLKEVSEIYVTTGTWPLKPIARVRVVEVKDSVTSLKQDYGSVDDGYQLVDVKTGFIWLVFGTDNEDFVLP